jgi:hypothetical protein
MLTALGSEIGGAARRDTIDACCRTESFDEQSMPIETNDWRLRGQQKVLQGKAWTWKKYKKYRADWDHDHWRS